MHPTTTARAHGPRDRERQVKGEVCQIVRVIKLPFPPWRAAVSVGRRELARANVGAGTHLAALVVRLFKDAEQERQHGGRALPIAQPRHGHGLQKGLQVAGRQVREGDTPVGRKPRQAALAPVPFGRSSQRGWKSRWYARPPCTAARKTALEKSFGR